MNFAKIVFLTLILLVAAGAQAGTIHPALQAELDGMAADERISVLVHLTEQADIAGLELQLVNQRATRQDRHLQVIQALQRTAAESQPALANHLEEQYRSGGILGYTTYWITNMMVVYATKDAVLDLVNRPDVDFIESNFSVELIEPVTMGMDDGPHSEMDSNRGIGVTPGLRAIRADMVWYELGYTGAGRLIGSLDTGVEGTHPALTSRWRGNHEPWNECWLDVLGGGTTYPVDNHGHGTHTTGTMTGVADDDTVGVAWEAEWIATNAIDQGVSSDFDNDIIVCLQWFADPDGNPFTVDDVPDVIQNSWRVNEGFPGGYTDCDSRWWTAIDNCEASGVVTCWSAGNEGSSSQTIGSPADRATTVYNCFSIGAVDATAYSWPYPIAGFSSRGPSGCPEPPANLIKPEVVGPGVDVYSSVRGGGYQDGWNGTSMSGPHVAGIVALMREANPDIDVNSIKQILLETARDEGSVGEDNTYGWGFVDAHAAVIAATVGFGNMQGHVYNASYGNAPIAGATVELLGSSYSFSTDASGAYSGSAAADSYTARASRAGFSSQDVAVDLVSGEVVVQDFYLNDIAGPEITDVDYTLATTDTYGPYAVSAEVTDFSTVQSVTLYYRINGMSWNSTGMVLTRDTYTGSIPGQPANTQIDFYIQAEDGIGLESTSPAGAPGDVYSMYITEVTYSYEVEDPEDPGWQLGVAGDTATTGLWVRVDPNGTMYNGDVMQTDFDHTPAPGTLCFVTGNGTPGGEPGVEDVDDGCTTLLSPTFDLSSADMAFVKYWRWYAEAGFSTDDEFYIDVSNDGGTSWVEIEMIDGNQNFWAESSIDLNAHITLTDQVMFRFLACDNNNGGLVEAAIDDFALEVFSSGPLAVPEDEFVPGMTRIAYLLPNQPNPFYPARGATTIQFRLRETTDAQLQVYDVSGRLVSTLHSGELTAGTHGVNWTGKDDRGHAVGSGVYFCRLKVGEFEQSMRMTVLK